jgi:hypothetical protein
MSHMRASALALLVSCAIQASAPPMVQKTSTGLAYERAGSGPPVVLIHGAFLDLRMWNREFDALKSRWTVIRYDLRMHGQSAAPSGPFSHVVDLFGLLDELKIDKATLIGLSNGAQTCRRSQVNSFASRPSSCRRGDAEGARFVIAA